MGIKAGFIDDRLFDISSVCMDDLVSAPAAPPAGQLEIYSRSDRLYKKNSSAVEKIVGPQNADEVPVNTGTGDNTLIGAEVQAILNKYYGPTNSEKAAYLGNGEVDYVEFFKNATQTTGNRIAKATFTYDGNLNPTSEIILVYDADGTTVLKTMTFTHTFISGDYDKTTQVTS